MKLLWVILLLLAGQACAAALTDQEQKEFLFLQHKAATDTVTVRSEVTEWTKLIKDSILDVAHGLGIEVNEFVKTPVGKMVGFLIIWEVIGKDIAAVGLLLLLAVMVAISFKHFNWGPRVKWDKIKKEYITLPSYQYDDNDNKAISAAAHCIVFVVLIVVSVIILAL